MFKQRIKDCFQQEWVEKINDSTRSNTYKLICDFNCKTSLDTIEVSKFRIALTRLRTSSHRLEIETGRWHKPNPIPLSERKCPSCNILEDEYHFLLECPIYITLRKQYINRYYWKHPNIMKFIEFRKLKCHQTTCHVYI